MRTDIIKGGEIGVLKVKSNAKGSKKIIDQFTTFPTETLFDWYPLNPHYSYKYSEVKDLFYLTVDQENLTLVRYGVSKNLGGVTQNRVHIEKGLKVGQPKWLAKAVQEENQKVFDFASKLGICTPREKYTMQDILKGYHTIQKALDSLYHTALERFTYTEKDTELPIDKTESIEYNGKVYYQMKQKEQQKVGTEDTETHMQGVLAELNDEEQELYIQIGEIYTMLSLMQKIAIAKE